MPHKDHDTYNAYMKDYMLRRYYERKAYGIKKLGGKCSTCDSAEDLVFDHIDPAEKSFTIGKLWSASWKKFVTELEKCQLLCNDCHKRKTYGSVA